MDVIVKLGPKDDSRGAGQVLGADQVVVSLEYSADSREAARIAAAFRKVNDERCRNGILPVKVHLRPRQASSNQSPEGTNTAPIPDLQEASIGSSPLRSGIAVQFGQSTPLEKAGLALDGLRNRFDEIFGEPAEQIRATIGREGR